MISIHAPLHVAINVSDLSRAEAFYGGVLGLQKVDRSLKFPGIWYQVGEFQLHLIEAADWQTSAQHPKWGRNAHVAFAIADVEAAKSALVEADWPGSDQRFGASGAVYPGPGWQYYRTDPDCVTNITNFLRGAKATALKVKSGLYHLMHCGFCTLGNRQPLPTFRAFLTALRRFTMI